jgi:hypothetical protein
MKIPSSWSAVLQKEQLQAAFEKEAFLHGLKWKGRLGSGSPHILHCPGQMSFGGRKTKSRKFAPAAKNLLATSTLGACPGGLGGRVIK